MRGAEKRFQTRAKHEGIAPIHGARFCGFRAGSFWIDGLFKVCDILVEQHHSLTDYAACANVARQLAEGAFGATDLCGHVSGAIEGALSHSPIPSPRSGFLPAQW